MAEPARTLSRDVGSEYALELRGIGKRFGALDALTDVNLRVKPGERHAILGSNGAGKTTLFNCVTGDFPPTTGEVRFFGENINAFPAYERIRRGLRRTYQISLLFNRLSVRDNVYLACRGVSSGRFSFIRRGAAEPLSLAADDLMQIANLSEARDELVSDLSYGQQRQLEIALALAGAPRLILFDEPAAGLSPKERKDLVAILRRMPAHIGYVIIEHDMDVALSVSDRVTMMHNGRVITEGRPEQIEKDPEVQALYLGAGHD